MLLGCASSTAKQPAANSSHLEQSLDYVQCGGGEFRGFGIGNSKENALNAAYSDLAKQVSSSIKVTETHNKNQSVRKGAENISSEYASKIVIKANLSNLNDAYILRTEQRANEKTETVVCMSKAKAAKEYIEREHLITDSLDLLSNAALNTEHPKRKNDAWHKSQMLWGESIKIQNLLENWGIKPAMPSTASESYSKIRENYKDYCQGQKAHWEENAKGECYNASFSELSKRIKIEKSECAKGLKFKFSCAEKCKSSSFGIECSFEPSLAIESCKAEAYSLLMARESVMGSDMYSESRAKEKLVENLSKAAFFNEWEKEIKEWLPKCTE
jgi:hypothetical protein